MPQEEFFKRYQYNLRDDKLGGGAFGTAYKAYDNVLDKYVAIKIAEVKTFGDKSFSLLDEFEAIRELSDHQNIANYEKVYTFEQPTGTFDFAIIQYYPHGNLSTLIKNENLSEAQKEDIALQILEGLRFLHEHKVVHRDMKPSNILIHKRNNGKIVPKIADFGLSKKAEPGAQSRFTNSFGGGTLEYSSPEQLRGQPLRFNTDLWAWSVITYELLTGKMLFEPTGSHSTGSAEREKELFEQILNKDLTRAFTELPTNWQNALLQCLQRDADKRVKTADQIKAILKGKETIEIKDDALTISIVDDKTVITPKQELEFEPAKKTNPTPNPIKKTGLWIGLGVLFLLVVGIWLFRVSTTTPTSSQQIGSVQQHITKTKAREMFTDFQNANIETNFRAISNLFASNIEVLHALTNTTFYEAQNNIKQYHSRWNVKRYRLQDFYHKNDNFYHYDMLFVLQKRETGKYYEYSISGKIGFVKERGEWKINYIKDLVTKKIRTYY